MTEARETLIRARDAVRDLVRAKESEYQVRLRGERELAEPGRWDAPSMLAAETSSDGRWTPMRLAVFFDLEGLGISEMDAACPLAWAALDELLVGGVRADGEIDLERISARAAELARPA